MSDYHSSNDSHSRKPTRYDQYRPTSKSGPPMSGRSHSSSRTHDDRSRTHGSPQRRTQHGQFGGHGVRSVPKPSSNPRKGPSSSDRGYSSNLSSSMGLSGHRSRRDANLSSIPPSISSSSSHHSRNSKPLEPNGRPVSSNPINVSMSSRHRSGSHPTTTSGHGSRVSSRFDYQIPDSGYSHVSSSQPYSQDMEDERSVRMKHDRSREAPLSVRPSVFSREKVEAMNQSNHATTTSSNLESSHTKSPRVTNATSESGGRRNDGRQGSSSPPPVLRQLVESLPKFDPTYKTLLPVSTKPEWFTLQRMGDYLLPKTNRKIITGGENLEEIGGNDDLGFGNLHMQMSSPWSNEYPVSRPDFILPKCYYSHPPSLKISHLTRFEPVTLFYIFYYMPRDTLQVYAAKELCRREFQYHETTQTWLKKENGSWKYFDHDVNVFEMRDFEEGFPEVGEPNVGDFMPREEIEAMSQNVMATSNSSKHDGDRNSSVSENKKSKKIMSKKHHGQGKDE